MLLKNWDWIRVLRLVMGIAILIQAFMLKDWAVGLAGIFLSALPILNIGCCGVSGCSTTPAKENLTSKEITYEEIN